MNKEAAVEAMATFVYESILNEPKDGSRESYIETCTSLYDFMKENEIIA
jgi:hypothetical protein